MKGLPLKRCFFLLAAVSMLCTDAGAAAERTLRCNGRLVSIGDSQLEVRDKCGDPDHLSGWEEGRNTRIARIFDYETERYRAPQKVDTPIQMQRWTYDFGPTRFIRHLYFENGELIHIEAGPKGGR